MQKDLQEKKNPTHWDKLLIIDDKNPWFWTSHKLKTSLCTILHCVKPQCLTAHKAVSM